MNKIFYIITITALLIGLCACSPNQPVNDEKASENDPDWVGTYTGVIPAAAGPGINVTIILNSDSTYEAQYQYIGRPDGEFTVNGTYKWDVDTNLITLDTVNIPPYYHVGENRLVQLDMEGSPITGTLADDYVLRKQ